MQVTVHKGLIGNPEVKAGLSDDGKPMLVIHYEGTRMSLVFDSSDEANTIANAITGTAAVSDWLAAERTKQLVDAKGVNVRDVLGGKH